MPPLTRRRLLEASAASAAAAVLASCGTIEPTPSTSSNDRSAARPTPQPPPSTASATAAATVDSEVVTRLYRDAAIADGRSDRPEVGQSILVADGVIRWIRPSDDEGPLGSGHVEVIDASGSTIVPGLVDAHSHVTLAGGARWIDRGLDPPERLLEAADRNAALLLSAGVRWARDVGAPRGRDPEDGRERALSIGLRDRWRGERGRPVIRAAGTWLTKTSSLPAGLAIEVDDADELREAALTQLDEGADFVKLYLDGPDPATSPWSVAEVRAVVDAVHARGAKVTAHSGRLDGARVGASAAVDSLEHGFELDADVARTMVRNGVALVSTLTVFRSWLSFGRTTSIPRFASSDGRAAIRDRRDRAVGSVRMAHRAGVTIAAGTDFGGGSARANQLAWEVESLVEAGLEPWEALGAATWRGGELLGEREAGVLREGGPADFVLVHGDPTSDASALWRVWHAAWA